MHQQRQIITDQHNPHHKADIIWMIDNPLNVLVWLNATSETKLE